jgi:hypothetical protein
VEGHKAEKLFSLIYGLSLTIMKDIQGVFWGCPRIEALFWPGLGGYVTALTGRALEWHSRGQRFDPAYLHQGTPQRELWCFLRLEYERGRAASADENIPETFHGFGDVFLFDLTVMPAGGG